jgi:hypothetical protein
MRLRGIEKDRKGQISDVFSDVFFSETVLLHAKTRPFLPVVVAALFMRRASTP